MRFIRGLLLSLLIVPQPPPQRVLNTAYQRDRHECPVVPFTCHLLPHSHAEEVCWVRSTTPIIFPAAHKRPLPITPRTTGVDVRCLRSHFTCRITDRRSARDPQLRLCNGPRWRAPTVQCSRAHYRPRKCRRGRRGMGHDRIQVPLCRFGRV